LDKYSRGLTILKGAVPGRTRGSGHMAPTYFCRFPGSKSDGSGGSALICRRPKAPAQRASKDGPHSERSPCPSGLASLASQGDGATMALPDTVAELKATIRRDALVRRDALPAEARARAAEAIAARPFPISIAPGAVVSAFSPLKSEINPIPLMRALAAAGAQLALPVVVGRGHPLTMRAWRFGAPLVAGVWGIREPAADAPEVDPDILLVPLLAFDRQGNRIGYGAGYYDMTITRLRAKKPVVACGIAYAAQEIDAVPVTPRDARLDLVLTERDVIDFRG
jgi:5-formyltetrahydrofolate cyclo-ligase